MPRLVFRPEARQEAREARDWYEGKAHGLGLEFTRAIDATTAAIKRFPESFFLVAGPYRQAVLGPLKKHSGLTYSHMGMYSSIMPRALTTSDAFNAIAEPRRRAILELLCESDRAVNDVVELLGFDQPSVSKHLRVLRKVELVKVRSNGRRRIYSANPKALKPVAVWVHKLEQFWDHHLGQIKVTAERRAKGDKQ